jgi:ankyrin repeat protein
VLLVAEMVRLVDSGECDVNEVEAAGNTPLHNAAFEGWVEGIELLLALGAAVNASNNAGDTPWHWAKNMGHGEVMKVLEQVRESWVLGPSRWGVQ